MVESAPTENSYKIYVHHSKGHKKKMIFHYHDRGVIVKKPTSQVAIFIEIIDKTPKNLDFY